VTGTIDLGNDVDDAPIDRVALTGQLRKLLEEFAEPFTGSHVNVGCRCDIGCRCGRGHGTSIALRSDKFQ
jgi:hypothetical protein